MIIQRFAFWNPGTWQIPKLYWDAFSDEQRIHAICKQLGKVIAYADYLGINVDDIAERLKAIEEGQIDPIIVAAVEEWFEEHQEDVLGAITDLEEALPITDYSPASTVSDRFNAIESKFPLGEGEIADDAVSTDKLADDAVTADKLADDAVNTDNIVDDSVTFDKINSKVLRYIDTIAESNYPTSAIEPIYVGDVLDTSGFQGLAVNGDDVYMAFRDGTNTTSHIRRISLSNNNIVSTYTNALISHGNSLAYDTVRDVLLIAVGTIYTLDRTMTTFDTFIDQPDMITCIAFDNVTETLWAMAGYAGDATQTLYKMESDETEFTQFAIIDNIPSRQDITVNNDILFINSSRADCSVFSINRDDNSISFIDSITFAHHDTSNRWLLSEPEGICIDSNGRFWIGYNNGWVTANQDGTTTYNGIVCNVPYKGVSYPSTYTTTINHDIVYMRSNSVGVFKLGVTDIRSFAQLKWLNTENVKEIQVSTNYTDSYNGWIPKGSMVIAVNTGCTLTHSGFIYVVGGIIQLRNAGTIVNDTGLFAGTNTPMLFIMRNTGTITLTTGSSIVAAGVMPVAALINNVGTLSGTYTIGSTNITGNNQYIIGARTGTY